MILAGNVFQETGNAYILGGDVACTGGAVYEVEMKDFYLRFSHESHTSVNVNKVVPFQKMTFKMISYLRKGVTPYLSTTVNDCNFLYE